MTEAENSSPIGSPKSEASPSAPQPARLRGFWILFVTQFQGAFSDNVYRTLAQLPRGPVIELPYWYERLAYPRHAEYMLTSTAHWQPLINGYSDHIPKDFRDTATPLSTFPSRESFAILEQLGARYAVFHLDLMDPRTREKLIERVEGDYKAHLRPIEKDAEVWLFEIVSWPR